VEPRRRMGTDLRAAPVIGSCRALPCDQLDRRVPRDGRYTTAHLIAFCSVGHPPSNERMRATTTAVCISSLLLSMQGWHSETFRSRRVTPTPDNDALRPGQEQPGSPCQLYRHSLRGRRRLNNYRTVVGKSVGPIAPTDRARKRHFQRGPDKYTLRSVSTAIAPRGHAGPKSGRLVRCDCGR